MIPNAQKFNKYSTEETNTGEKWIDGKPIYRKTFTITTKGTIDVSSLNIENAFFDFSNSNLKWSNQNRIVPLALVTCGGTSENQAGVYFNSTFTGLVIEAGSAVTIGNSYITIRYTKK